MTVRVGVVVLPDLRWSEAEPRWRAVEEMGFDHGWTYDHLVWGGLPDSPWFGTTPTLSAAALVTERIGLGTFVSSPNFRHPVTLWRDVQSLDDLSGGRFLLGVGTGGDLDSRILAGEDLSVGERVERFQEFTDLLLQLRGEDHVDADGRWFSARDARTLPRPTPVPVLVAANGPRSVRYAARVGDGWVTTGRPADSLEQWWGGLADARTTFDEALRTAGRDPADVPRYLNLDSSPVFSLDSVMRFHDMVGRAEELGFTDVVVHWPRAEPPYQGDVTVLEQVASARG